MGFFDWLSRRAGCSVAGVPCVSDTCSIKATIDSFGKLSLNSNLDPKGGLACGTNLDPNAGLRVALYGDPVAVGEGTLNECDSLLGLTTAGHLFVKRPGFQVKGVGGLGTSGTDGDFPGGTNGAFAGPSGDQFNHSFTNNAECARLMIVKTTANFNFNTQTGFGYSLDAVFAVEYNPGSVFTHSITRAGQPSDPGAGATTDFHSESFEMIQFVQINGGQTINIKSYGQKLTSSQHATASPAGVDTEATKKIDSEGDGLGYNADLSVIILDLAPRTLV